MDFFVYSRAVIERIAPHDVPHLIVSITSRADDLARLPIDEHTLEVVRLSFLDVGAGAPGAMTAEDARAILAAFDRHRGGLARIVAHCDAGMSRSPAVAIALARRAGQDDTELVRRYRPNSHVIAMLAEPR